MSWCSEIKVTVWRLSHFPMKRFSISGLIVIAALGSVVAAEFWQRRKLRRLLRHVGYEGRLMHAAIRITNDVRGSLNIPRTLNATALEFAATLSIEHCSINLLEEGNQSALACSCGESEHDGRLSTAFDSAREIIEASRADRYVNQGIPDGVISESDFTTIPVMGVPITHDGRLLGTVLVFSKNSHRIWLESEVQLMLTVAHQLSLSVSHARVFAAKEQESLTDALTNCLNRRAFERQLEEHFQAAAERGQRISLIIIDLDLFKSINDNYGHPVGDQVLRRLAEILLEQKVNGAIAARIGGEEFALILPYQSIEESAAIAERVRKSAELITIPEFECRVTVSCGVASAPINAGSPDSLFVAADKALYRAKTSGRNRVCLY